MPSLQDRQRAFSEGPHQSEPYDVWPGDADRMPPFPFPRLYARDQIPGWELVKQTSVKKAITERVNESGEMKLFALTLKPGRGYAILDLSDFHITFGEYRKVKE